MEKCCSLPNYWNQKNFLLSKTVFFTLCFDRQGTMVQQNFINLKSKYSKVNPIFQLKLQTLQKTYFNLKTSLLL